MRIYIYLLLLFNPLSANFLDTYHLYKAKYLYSKGYYSKALKHYQDLSKKDEVVRYNLANIYYKLKQYDKALDLYKSIESPRLELKKLYNIAECFFRKHQYKKAKLFYEEVLKFSPNDSDALFNLKVTNSILKNLSNSLKRDKINKLKRHKGLGKGKYEGRVNDWEKFDADMTLKEAKYSKILKKLNNKANIVDKRASGVEGSRALVDDNKTIIKKNSIFYLENKRYRYNLEQRGLKSLLIPLIDKKELDNESY